MSSAQPLRATVMGPPAVGKTTVVKQLCEHYKLHHIHLKSVIDEALEELQKSAARVDAPEEEEGEDSGKAQEDSELLEQINQSKEENGGRIEDQFIKQFVRNKLNSKPCQNQGFILDGYPKTQEQAKELFAGKFETNPMPLTQSNFYYNSNSSN